MRRIIFSYDRRFVIIFDRKKKRISKTIKGIEIHHIGSTAVPGLGGKGMVDIMIGIKNWKELGDILKKLRKIGFKHVHPKENGRVFLSEIGPTKLGDVHIHIVKIGGKIYRELLAFRDYLRKNKSRINKFFKLKKLWEKETKGDRNEYGRLKEKHVKKILSKVIK